MAKPVADVVRSARLYQRAQGLHLPEARYSQTVTTAPAIQQIAAAYDRLPHFDAGALPAYRAMAEETGRQFDHMTKPRSKGGLGIDVQVTHDDPYGKNSVHDVVNEFRDDVVNHSRMKVLSTASTGGHPVFTNDQNDMFRAVHDVYGHLGSGRGIDMHGEEAAFQKHSRMFSPLARQAMATETRGQNAALQAHGEFQDQKVAIMPRHLQDLQFSRIAAATDLVRAVRDAREENRKQGL